MARTAGKKQAPQKFEEPEEAEGWEDAVVETEGKDGEADLRLRDWRDVERFREMKDLRRLVDDDYGLEEIFHIHLKPRVEVPPRQPKALPASAKLAAAKLAAAKQAAVKQAAARPVAAPAPKAPPPKALAKAAAKKPAPKAHAKAKAHARPKAKPKLKAKKR